MLYDNGGLPAPQRTQMPQPGFSQSANGLSVPLNPARGYTPPVKIPKPRVQNARKYSGTFTPWQPGGAPPVQFMFNRYRNGGMMQPPQQMPQPGMQQQNPMQLYSQYQSRPPQYQGNPYLPMMG